MNLPAAGPPCPVCGGPWPWLYYRDTETRELVGCTHDIEYAVPVITEPPI